MRLEEGNKILSGSRELFTDLKFFLQILKKYSVQHNKDNEECRTQDNENQQHPINAFFNFLFNMMRMSSVSQ